MTTERRRRSPSSSSPILLLAATLALLFLLAAVEAEGSPRGSDHTTRDTNMPWHADPRPRPETDPWPVPESETAHDPNQRGRRHGAGPSGESNDRRPDPNLAGPEVSRGPRYDLNPSSHGARPGPSLLRPTLNSIGGPVKSGQHGTGASSAGSSNHPGNWP